MKPILAVFKREFAAYFATPLAYVFIVIFLFAMGAFTFYIGHFFENGTADLQVFFGFHPWLYLFLVPAISMRLGPRSAALARWSSCSRCRFGFRRRSSENISQPGIYRRRPCPDLSIWITVNYLGHPDNGVILASYIGSFLMAGLSRDRRLHFGVDEQPGDRLRRKRRRVLPVHDIRRAARARFLQRLAPLALVNAISSFSFLTHFTAISQASSIFAILSSSVADRAVPDGQCRHPGPEENGLNKAMKPISRRSTPWSDRAGTVLFVAVNIAADATFTTTRSI